MTKVKEKKQFKGQYDDEEVLLVFRKHPVVMRKGLIFFALAFTLSLMPIIVQPYIAPDFLLEFWHLGVSMFAGLLLGTIVAFPSWIYWYFSLYIMTNQRFVQITQKGFFHRSVSDIGINHVQSVNFQVAGIQETLLGFGSVLIQTYLGDIMIRDVHHPEKTSNDIFAILREYGDVTSVNREDVGQIQRPNNRE